MPDLTTLTLPVLPLTTGVVLPQMVVTVALETDEARAAAKAAGDDGHLLLVPRIDGRYASVGASPASSRPASCPTAPPPSSSAPCSEPGSVPASSAPARRSWLQAEPVAETEPTEEARQLASRAQSDAPGRGRAHRRPAPRRVARAASTTPATLADTAGWWPDLLDRAQGRAARDGRRRPNAWPSVLAWAQESLAELEVTERIRDDVTEGMEKTQREFLLRQQLAAIRKELGEGDDDDAAAELPHQARRDSASCPRRSAPPSSARSTGSSARSEQSPGARLDPHVARHRARAAVGQASPTTTSTWPRRGRSSTPTTPASTT